MIMELKWLSNLHDPELPNHEMTVSAYIDEPPHLAVQREKEWLQGKIIGRPQASDTYTVEQLETMGMVGIYKRVSNPELAVGQVWSSTASNDDTKIVKVKVVKIENDTFLLYKKWLPDFGSWSTSQRRTIEDFLRSLEERGAKFEGVEPI